MDHRLGELTHRTVGHDMLVHRTLVVPQRVAKEAHGAIPFPAAVPNLAAQEEVSAPNAVCRGPSPVRDRPAQLIAKPRGAALVGVHHENPLVLRALDRRVALAPDGGERVTEDRGAGSACPRHGIVGRVVLDHDHLGGPGNAPDALGDLIGLVLRRDDDRTRHALVGASFRAHVRQRLRSRATSVARSNPSIISVSVNSRETRARPAFPIAARRSA